MTTLSIYIREKSFPGPPGSPRRRVLREVQLTVPQGQLLCILGPSGCGKTTLLNLIAGVDDEFEGRIRIANTAPDRELKIGYVFQSPALLPWRTVAENVRLVMAPQQVGRGLHLALLKAMGLSDYVNAYPKSLSLGMSRRAALARALAVEPDLLLMDEPFVSLDESTAEGLRRLVLRIWRETGMTVLVVTHDSREAIRLAERIIVLSGSPATVAVDRVLTMTAEQRSDPLNIDIVRTQLFLGHASVF